MKTITKSVLEWTNRRPEQVSTYQGNPLGLEGFTDPRLCKAFVSAYASSIYDQLEKRDIHQALGACQHLTYWAYYETVARLCVEAAIVDLELAEVA